MRGGLSTPSSSDAPAEARDSERATAKASILVVDDEPMARQMFTDLLEAHGFRVITVGRGEEAFAFLNEVELVVLDAMLPGRDGWSICKEIKENYDPLLPIIMVTARTAPEDVVRTFTSGADDYVSKPFHVAELTARIESRLRVHRAELAIKQTAAQLRELADQNYKLYEQARRDAEERALLLRELDHRVRNNMAVISGLVSMERNRRPPRDVADALESLENRLRSFIMVHEALRRQNYKGVPIRETTEKLAQRLRNAWDVAGHIEVKLEGDSPIVDEKQGFATSLILNELITNAFRHGLPNGREGTVVITITEIGDQVRIEVSDDGVGTTMVRQKDAVGSGRSIVLALARDELNGEFEFISSENGSRAVVTFPHKTS
ncbi:MAG TPA: response regulator [Longimicrobiales bacterium]|nr:response regulator [Longimicrobiales bacterium]